MTTAFLVYVDMNPALGVELDIDAAQANIQGALENALYIYNPEVELAPAELQPNKEGITQG